MVNIFIHYNNESAKDAEFFKEIEKRLTILRNKQAITNYWHTGLLDAGDDIAAVIQQELMKAHIVLLLISPDYFPEANCKARHDLIMLRKTQLRIVPVLLRPMDLDGTDVKTYATLPKASIGETFLSKWEDLDEAYLHIELELKGLALEASAAKDSRHRESLLGNSLMRFNFNKEIPPYRRYLRDTSGLVYAVLVQGTAQCSQSLLFRRLIGESKFGNPKLIPVKLDSSGQSASLDQIWMRVGESFGVPVPIANLVCAQLSHAMINNTEVVLCFDPVERYHLDSVRAFWAELLQQLEQYKAYLKKPLYFYLLDRNALKDLSGDELCHDHLMTRERILHLQIAKLTEDDFENWLSAERAFTPDNPLLDEIENRRNEIMPNEEAYVGEVIENICKVCGLPQQFSSDLIH